MSCLNFLRRDRCHWCGTETFSSRKVGDSHPKCSTIDHVRSKPECLTKKEYMHHSNKVNACWKCNQERAQEWNRKVRAGLVYPTAWSLTRAERAKRQRENRKARLERQEFLRNCKPCRVVKIDVPPELSAAYSELSRPSPPERWRSGNF